MWILIIVFYAGVMADGDSVSLASVEFTSKQSCEIAGVATKKLETGKKDINYVCVQK